MPGKCLHVPGIVISFYLYYKRQMVGVDTSKTVSCNSLDESQETVFDVQSENPGNSRVHIP